MRPAWTDFRPTLPALVSPCCCRAHPRLPLPALLARCVFRRRKGREGRSSWLTVLVWRQVKLSKSWVSVKVRGQVLVEGDLAYPVEVEAGADAYDLDWHVCNLPPPDGRRAVCLTMPKGLPGSRPSAPLLPPLSAAPAPLPPLCHACEAEETPSPSAALSHPRDGALACLERTASLPCPRIMPLRSLMLPFHADVGHARAREASRIGKPASAAAERRAHHLVEERD